jgi:hypothetical protein
VRPASEAAVTHAYQILSERLPRVELLTGYEGTAFGTTGNTETDLLSITSVHPMREDAVRSLLAKGGADWNLVERLLEGGALAEIEYQGQKHYLRRFARTDGGPAHPPGGRAPA